MMSVECVALRLPVVAATPIRNSSATATRARPLSLASSRLPGYAAQRSEHQHQKAMRRREPHVMRSDPQSAALVRRWHALAVCGALVLATPTLSLVHGQTPAKGRWVATWATAVTPRVDAAPPAQNPPAAPAPARTSDPQTLPNGAPIPTGGQSARALQQPDDSSDRAYQRRWFAGACGGEQHVRDVAARHWRGADCDARQGLVDRARSRTAYSDSTASPHRRFRRAPPI